MKNSQITIAVIAILALILFIGGCSVRNGIIERSNAVDRSWSDVESSYQRRLDLIPNLVETVKGYAKHESETFQNVTEARARTEQLEAAYQMASDPNASQEQRMTAYSQLDSAFRPFINAVSEAYPDLKANENFMDLQKQLEGTENRINTARNEYNAAVEQYDNSIMKFPGSLVAWGFSKRSGFKAAPAASTAPKVEF